MNRFKILKLPMDSTPCYSPKKTSEEIIKEEKEGIITGILSTPEGRTRLAASMAQPLHRRLDYESMARQVMSVQPMPGGPLSQDFRYINSQGI
jgi:hypothetical protein